MDFVLRSIRGLVLLVVLATACSTGPVEVTVGDQTTQVEPGELERDVLQFGNALCFVLILGAALSVFAVIALIRYFGAERRSTSHVSSGPALAVGQQGVLTLQFLLGPPVRTLIDASLASQGVGAPALATLARTLTEHRASWQGVAARGSTLMEEGAAADECARIVTLFDARASQAGGGDEALLLTCAIRAPFDYSGVMPADIDGFSTVLSQVYDVPTDAPCAYQFGWTGVSYATYEDVVPGIVSV